MYELDKLEELQKDALRLIDRHKYYGKTPLALDALELLEALASVELYEITQKAYDEGMEHAESESSIWDELRDERDQLQDKLENSQDECKRLDRELSAALDELAHAQRGTAKPKRRAKDPFKGKTPAQMRKTLMVIKGALNEYE